MKLLHVIHSVDPRSGGPSHAIREMVRAQVALQHDVTVLANTVQSAEPWAPAEDYVREMQRDESFTGAELVLARSYGRHRPWNRFAWSPAARGWLNRRIAGDQRRPDVVHIHGLFSHLTTSAARFARKHRIPYIIRPTGALDRGCYEGGHVGLKRLFGQIWLRHDLEGASCMHVTSEAEAHSLRDRVAEERIRIVPLGVALPEFDRATAAEEFLCRFPQLRGRRVVLFLSRVAPIKRPELLVEALDRVAGDLPDVVLLFAGHDAGAMESLRTAVGRHNLHNRVVEAGFVQGREKRGAFAAADVFALPSLHENFGVAVTEAMAHGVPVLVTPGVASHAYVDASGCGLTVEGTAADLADGMRRLLAADRDTLGQRGRVFVEEHLSWPAMVLQIDRMYCDVLHAAARRGGSLRPQADSLPRMLDQAHNKQRSGCIG